MTGMGDQSNVRFSEAEREHVDQDRVPYQMMLRVIGQDLDRLHASNIRLIETSSGFAVQYVSDTSRAEIADLIFSFEDLLPRTRTGRFQPMLRHPRGGAKRFRHGKPTYQDFLRALGYELEEAGAYSILMDELDDGYLLTYQFYNPDSGFLLHKHRVALHADEAGEIVNAAGMRRGRVKRTRGA